MSFLCRLDISGMHFFIGREYCGQKNLCQNWSVTPLVISVTRSGVGSGSCAPAALGRPAGIVGSGVEGRFAESVAALGPMLDGLSLALAPWAGSRR